MLDVMFNLDSEWPVWMDFRALYSACLELANYLKMTISIIGIIVIIFKTCQDHDHGHDKTVILDILIH